MRWKWLYIMEYILKKCKNINTIASTIGTITFKSVGTNAPNTNYLPKGDSPPPEHSIIDIYTWNETDNHGRLKDCRMITQSLSNYFIASQNKFFLVIE